MWMNIGVDFDGTIVTHEFPEIGSEIGAFEWLKKFQEAGAFLRLWTMRSDGQANGDVLTQAVEHCRANGVEFASVNENPSQASWTASPKMYCQLYIDDAAFGCPLVHPVNGKRPFVDWRVVGPSVLQMIESYKTAGRSWRAAEDKRVRQ